MAFFQRGKFVWNEPWFFLHRIRAAKAWFLFSLFLSFVAVAVAVGILMIAPANKPPSLLTVIGLSLGVAACLWWDVVIKFATSDGDKELGLRYADRDYGEVTDTKRAAGGVQLFEALESVLPSRVLQSV